MRKTKGLRRRAYNSSDRALRTMIFKEMGDSQIDGKILVANMDAVFNWIKGSKSPAVARLQPPKVVPKAALK